MAIKQFNITELDFDSIKDEIKNYYKLTDSPFKDFDFDGSGLNLILDILAHNTHYNAVLAHLAANETFISSAQLRKNVVARAKSLGYTPKSVSAAAITITLSNLDSSITEIKEGTTFTATDTLNNQSYSFVVFDDVDNPTLPFSAHEGAIKRKEYLFDDKVANLKFEIPDVNVDRSKIVVSVSDSIGTTQTETYTQFSELPGIDGNSNVYFINENPNGRFEISFGDNVIGKKPLPGSVIQIKYLSTKGAAANGVSVFTNTSLSPAPTISIAGASSGGGSKESVESIRSNAPLQFLSQNRAVTTDDYKALIRSNSTAVAISVWGGEDNDPPEYGRVFISAKPANAATLTETEKNTLLPILDSKGILTVRPKFVDPEFTFIYFDIFVNYNSATTNKGAGSISALVRDGVSKFSDDNLETFDGVFRYSQFLEYISDLDPSIVSSYARVYCLKKFIARNANTTTYKLEFNFPLDNPSDPTESLISTSGFVSGGITYYLQDEETSVENIRSISRCFFSSDGVKVVDARNVGTIDTSTGIIEINDFNVDTDTIITLFARPESNDIAPKRNQIIEIDLQNTNITSTVDTIATRGTSGIDDYVTTPR
jgi:hypothetical protein